MSIRIKKYVTKQNGKFSQPYSKSKRAIKQKRRYNKNTIPTIVKDHVRFPAGDRLITTLVYGDLFSTSSTAIGVYQEQNFRLNSLQDPDFSGGGHKPYGSNEMFAFFNRYVVTKVDWKIKGFATSSLGWLTIIPMNTPTTPGTLSKALEEPRCKVQSLLPTQYTELSGSIDLAELTGVSMTTYLADDRFQAINGNNPLETMILHLGVSGPGGLTTMGYVAQFTYHVQFYDANELPQS